MKTKSLFLLVIFSLTFHLFACAADKTPAKPTIQVPKASKPVAIDGNLDEYGAPEIRMADKSFEKLQYLEYGGKDDISSDIYLLWDDGALYIAAKITDDKPFMNRQEGPDIWNGDAVEILLGMDEKADPERIYFGKSDYQIGLSPGNNKEIKAGEWVWRRDDYQSGIEVASKPWEKGYIIEAKVPFKVLGGYKPALGKRIDFNIAVDDSAADKRDAQIVWTGSKNFYNSPAEWGVAVLAAPQAAFAVSLSGAITVIIGIVIIVVFITFAAHRPK